MALHCLAECVQVLVRREWWGVLIGLCVEASSVAFVFLCFSCRLLLLLNCISCQQMLVCVSSPGCACIPYHLVSFGFSMASSCFVPICTSRKMSGTAASKGCPPRCGEARGPPSAALVDARGWSSMRLPFHRTRLRWATATS